LGYSLACRIADLPNYAQDLQAENAGLELSSQPRTALNPAAAAGLANASPPRCIEFGYRGM